MAEAAFRWTKASASLRGVPGVGENDGTNCRAGQFPRGQQGPARHAGVKVGPKAIARMAELVAPQMRAAHAAAIYSSRRYCLFSATRS